MRSTGLILLAVLAAGCASALPAPPARQLLAYSIPQQNPARYELVDSSHVDVAPPGMDNVRTTLALRTVADVAVHAESDGLLASVTLQGVEGSFETPMADAVTLEASDLPSGAALLSFGPHGVDSLQSMPTFNERFQRVAGGPALFHHFFMRLPGDTVGRGETWTDTVTVVDDRDALRSAVQMVITSSWQSDTTVAGSRLNVIRSSYSSVVEVEGTVEGNPVRQTLTGGGTMTSLWDPARALLVEQRDESEASGTMALPAVGVSGLPVSSTTRRTLRLLP